MTHFLETFNAFRSQSRPRIAIFKPSAAQKADLYSELSAELSKHAFVQIVDAVFLQSYEAIQTGFLDLLVVPEADLVGHADSCHIVDLLKNGGALMVSGGDLFVRGQTNPGESDSPTGPGEAETLFRRTIARMGIKPYVTDVHPTAANIDTDFIPSLPSSIDAPLPPAGAQFNTTSDRNRPFPDFGTQFASRYEVLRNYEVVTGTDELGRRLTSAVTFAQNWETGGRLALFATNGPGSALDPKSPLFAPLLEAAVRFTRNKVIISDARTAYACYRDGEDVVATYTVENFGLGSAAFDITVTMEGGAESFTASHHHEAAAGKQIFGQVLWSPKDFSSDYYTVTVTATSDGDVLSKAVNGFVVWKDEVVAQGPKFEVDDTYFKINGRKTILAGANYYESHQAAEMWVKPNVAKLHDDLEQMGEFGINFLRIHYHHPKWFHDHFLDAYGFVPEQYRELGASYLPNESHLRIYDAHVYLCQKYGIVYGGDILTLRPREMGDARGWFFVNDYLWFDEMLDKQKEFLTLLASRYLDVPGLTWDIYNEPMSAPEQMADFYPIFNTWAGKIRDHIRALGDDHAITVGDVMSTGAHDPVVDYHGFHASFRRSSTLNLGTRKPQLLQEVWLDRPQTPAGNQEQLIDMKRGLTDTFRVGLAGFTPWQWTEQLAMWQAENTFSSENWDDLLGCCVRGDATLKPSGRFFRDFFAILGDLEFREFHGDVVMPPGSVRAEAMFDFTAEFDGPTGETSITTDRGMLMIHSASAVDVGEHYLVLNRGGVPVRGIARGQARAGAFVISSDNDCDVWYRLDVADSTVRAKADVAGTLTVQNDKPLARVSLIDPTGNSNDLSLEFTADENGARIDIADWQTYYWLELTY